MKYFLIGFASLLILVFGLKQILGYSPIGYLYNVYYNSLHNTKVAQGAYKIKSPFFSWRINEKNDTQVIFYGMLTAKGFLKATFSDKSLPKSIDKIKEMCSDQNNIVKNIDINGYQAMDIYCENKNIDKLNPYRVIFIPKKLFIFMYDYQLEYDSFYNGLIANIMIFPISTP